MNEPAKQLPPPGEAPEVTHEQIYWAIVALQQSIDDLRVMVLKIEAKVDRAEELRTADSRTLTDTLDRCNKIGRKVDALDRRTVLMADELIERHQTDPAPPPDSEEITQPGKPIPTPEA